MIKIIYHLNFSNKENPIEDIMLKKFRFYFNKKGFLLKKPLKNMFF